MRVLFTTDPQSGHWQPLAPFAQELQQAGHAVVFAAAPSACAAISALRFRCFPAGEDETVEVVQERRQRAAALLGTEAATWAWPNFFAGIWAEGFLPELLAICQKWGPEVLVRENMESADRIAAEAVGLSLTTVQVTAWRP